eukprot:scaffold305_cov247-Pinguiococcus_pyrenoidosus.AAC.19
MYARTGGKGYRTRKGIGDSPLPSILSSACHWRKRQSQSGLAQFPLPVRPATGPALREVAASTRTQISGVLPTFPLNAGEVIGSQVLHASACSASLACSAPPLIQDGHWNPMQRRRWHAVSPRWNETRGLLRPGLRHRGVRAPLLEDSDAARLRERERERRVNGFPDRRRQARTVRMPPRLLERLRRRPLPHTTI